MPVYSFHLFTTRAQCDASLTPARRLAAQLNNRELNLSFDDTEDGARAEVAQAQLIGVNAELFGVNQSLAALPADPTEQRERLEVRQARLIARQKALQSRSGTHNEQVAGELTEARNDADMVVVNDYITQLEAHKATLPA
jgi:hypothetical protein